VQASVASRPSPHESRSTESTKIVRSSSSSGRSKESGTETTGLGPLAQLRTKSKGESNVDSKALANAVAAAAAAASVTATTRRSLKKGQSDHQIHFYEFLQFLHTTLIVSVASHVCSAGYSLLFASMSYQARHSSAILAAEKLMSCKCR
jgi:hypothetical protein